MKPLYDRSNQIIDEEQWLEVHAKHSTRRSAGETERLFPFIAQNLGGAELVDTICEGLDSPIAALYGVRPTGFAWVPATSVVLYDWKGEVQAQLELSNQLRALSPSDGSITPHVTHALARDGVVYVSIAHNTYASSTNGNNARVYAFSESGTLLWESPPLVSNARNFLLVGDVLLTGYGFTAEPDFLYQLSRHNGKIVAKKPLKSGPEYLVLDPFGVLHVRTYNRDVGFQLSQ